jgi:MipA family protein
MNKACLVPFVGMFALCAAPVQAQQPATGGVISDSGGWVITLKANAVSGPKYPGSSEQGFIAFPSASIRRAGTTPGFSAVDDGIGFALYDTAGFKAGPVVRYQSGRYLEGNPELRGLRDAKWAVEPGAFAEIWPVPDVLRARFEIRRGFHGHEGVVGNIGMDLVQRFGAWTLSGGPRVSLGDKEYMRSYFGVTPQDAAWNPRVVAFKPSGGVKGIGASGQATYKFNESWSTTLQAGYERLQGDAAKSPIVKSFGKRDQLTLGASLSYSFSWKGF